MKTIHAVDDRIRRAIRSGSKRNPKPPENAPFAANVPNAWEHNPAPTMIRELDSEAGTKTMKTTRIKEPKELRHGLDMLLFIADLIVLALCVLKYTR